jgi:Tol biopolymer transport system component
MKFLTAIAVSMLLGLVACGSSPTTGSGIAATPSRATGLPAQGRIAFSVESGPRGDYGNIFTIEPNGTGLRMLTTASVGSAADPAWSPIGDRIFFDVQFPIGTGWKKATSSSVFSMDVNGGSMRQLTSELSGVYDGDPAVSADGTRIAFDRFDLSGRLTGIWLMNPDGSNVVRVTTPPTSAAGGDQQPDFSPDGTMIVFDRDGSDNGDGAIYVVGIDGKGLRQVTPASLDATRPRWSPDESKFLFGNPDTASPDVGRNIYVVHADGSQLLALTHESGGDFAESPAWSPDGRMIVFDEEHLATNVIAFVVMHEDGSHPIVIWHTAPSAGNYPAEFPGGATWGKAP